MRRNFFTEYTSSILRAPDTLTEFLTVREEDPCAVMLCFWRLTARTPFRAPNFVSRPNLIEGVGAVTRMYFLDVERYNRDFRDGVWCVPIFVIHICRIVFRNGEKEWIDGWFIADSAFKSYNTASKMRPIAPESGVNVQRIRLFC